MKYYIFSLFMGFYFLPTRGQQLKKIIPFYGPPSWTTLMNPKINCDGSMVMYSLIEDMPTGKKKQLVIQSLKNKQIKNYPNIESGDFSQDGKFAILDTNGEKIQVDLASGAQKPFKTVQQKSNRWRITYQGDTLLNVRFKEKYIDRSFGNVLVYSQPDDSNRVLLFIALSHNERALFVADLSKNTFIQLWKGSNNFTASLSSENPTVPPVITIHEQLPAGHCKMPEVDVWSYLDANNPDPFLPVEREVQYKYMLTKQNKLIQLSGKYENVVEMSNVGAIVRHAEGASAERWWNAKARASFYYFSFSDGQKYLIKREGRYGFSCYFSPDAHFIVIGDDSSLSYSAYDTRTHELRDISKGKDITLRGASYIDIKYLSNDRNFTDNEHLIVRDQFDLWKLDLVGKTAPICISGEFGRKNGIEFRPLRVLVGNKVEMYTKQPYGYLLLSFDTESKEWGIYSVNSLNGDVPQKLMVGPYFSCGGENAIIMKAELTNKYLIQKESINDGPNLFVTNDLKKVERITNVQPHKDYNWMSVEKIVWETNVGRKCEGMLFKPEDFDSSKKYPVVTIIYNDFSQYKWCYPVYTSSEFGYGNYLPLTGLVSNGYLVFVPDISKRKPGEYLKETVRMLIPGVKMLQELPYVDAKKIGIEGSSWGGIQTNYIVSQTDVFAAAHSGCGNAELISLPGYSDQFMHRDKMSSNDLQLGGLLIENPKSYMEQSALFYAGNVKTPLLLRHNKEDSAVPFYQSLEYFRWLRRLGKPVWLLQYDGQGHGVQGIQFKDLCIRIGQFFDHYLKGAPAPLWMTKGSTLF